MVRRGRETPLSGVRFCCRPPSVAVRHCSRLVPFAYRSWIGPSQIWRAAIAWVVRYSCVTHRFPWQRTVPQQHHKRLQQQRPVLPLRTPRYPRHLRPHSCIRPRVIIITTTIAVLPRAATIIMLEQGVLQPQVVELPLAVAMHLHHYPCRSMWRRRSPASVGKFWLGDKAEKCWRIWNNK